VAAYELQINFDNCRLRACGYGGGSLCQRINGRKRHYHRNPVIFHAMNKHHIYAIAAGFAAGFYLANATSGTGIYANKIVGDLLAKIYSAGYKLGKPATTTA
jgi:hypothetical protein